MPSKPKLGKTKSAADDVDADRDAEAEGMAIDLPRAPEVPRIPEEVLDSNDKLGLSARWLVKSVGLAASLATWEPR